MNLKQQQYVERGKLITRVFGVSLGETVFVNLEDGWHQGRIQGFTFAHECEQEPLEHKVDIRLYEGRNMEVPIWKIKKC